MPLVNTMYSVASGEYNSSSGVFPGMRPWVALIPDRTSSKSAASSISRVCALDLVERGFVYLQKGFVYLQRGFLFHNFYLINWGFK